MVVEKLGFVVIAGVFTAILCGLGTLPFFFVDEISDRVTVVLWGLAGGIMLFASLFGFIVERLAEERRCKSAPGCSSASGSWSVPTV